MSTINIPSIHSVEIDGQHVGNVVEAILNFKSIDPASFQTALEDLIKRQEEQFKKSANEQQETFNLSIGKLQEAVELARADAEAKAISELQKAKAEGDAKTAAALLAAQTKYDEIVQRAEQAISAGNMQAITGILEEAKQITSAARKKKLEDNIEKLKAALADHEAQLSAQP